MAFNVVDRFGRVVPYQRVEQTEPELRGCLASGYPFVFGFSVYESFESVRVTRTGVVPMPSRHESVLGGHAVLAVGYDDAEQSFIVRNSWGTGWGDKGFAYASLDYAQAAFTEAYGIQI